MVRRLASVSLSLLLPLAGRVQNAPTPRPADGPTRAERFVGSAVAYAACGVPPLVIAGLAAMYGWTAPVLAAFAAGGAALALVEPEPPRDQAPLAALRATSGAVRGVVLFPVMTGFAGQRVWGPVVAAQLHRWRHRADPPSF